VLVNFGRNKVVISPDTKIAKVMFLPLDSDTTKPVGEWDKKKYDYELAAIAANAPQSFLQLESFLPNIEERANAKLEAMDKQIESTVGDIANHAKFDLEKELGEKMKRSFFKGHIGLFAGFLFGLSVVFLVIITFLPRLAAEYSGVEELARKAVMAQQAETFTGLTTRLDSLATEIESVKKQLSIINVGEDKTQGQDNSSDTTRLISPENIDTSQ
jgi:hypothetical protein